MKATPTKFPLVLKKGSSVVKIYDAKDGFPYFRLSYHMGGRRIMKTFADLDGAKGEAAVVLQNLAKGDLDALQLSGKDRLIYGRALAAVQPFDVALDDAARDYAAARKILGTHLLVDAAKYFVRHHSTNIIAKPVEAVVAALVEEKAKEGLSAVYVADLRQRCGRFATAFKCNMNDVSAEAVKAFLDSLPVGKRTFNNFHGALRTLFAFAKAHKHMAREFDPLETAKKKKAKGGAIEIFTPGEITKLLQHSTPELLPLLAIGAFAGVRNEEMMRLEWKDVKLAERFIEVAADKAKTAARRIVPISENLAQWLAPYAKKAGPIWPHSKPYFFEALAKVAVAAGVEWKDNGLRHSFISYRVATLKNVNEVALEAGNSAGMIFKNYREVVREADGKNWFAIAPATAAANVIPIRAAA